MIERCARFNGNKKEKIMSDKRASPLAAAFMWAVASAAVYGGIGLTMQENRQQITDAIAVAAPLAAVVAYRERQLLFSHK